MTIFEIRSNNVTNYDLKKFNILKVRILVTKSNKINVVTFNFIHFQILIYFLIYFMKHSNTNVLNS